MSDDPASIEAWQQQMRDDIVARLRAVLHNDRSVELMNREAADEIERLRAERDEARRDVCMAEANHLPTMADPRREAKRRGWDCFKEKR
jgi:hypothetical protein